MYFIPFNGLAKYKQQTVFYLYFYVPWLFANQKWSKVTQKWSKVTQK